MTIRTIPFASLTPALLQAAIATRRDGINITLYEAGDTVPPLTVVPDPDAALRPSFNSLLVKEREAQFSRFKAHGPEDEAATAAARQYVKLQNLVAMTPAQVVTWVSANVTNLTQAQDAIATLAVAVSVLGRKFYT